MQTELIAEACLNHNGELEKALELISVAKACNCPTIKFQYYLTDILCVNRNCFGAYKLLDKVRLRPQWIPILAEECKRKRIEFLCTGFDEFSIEEISPYVNRYKIASPEVTVDFVKHVASYGKPIIISNGKASQETLDAIFDAVTVPISILYCRSLYPANPSDYDLNEIDRLRERYKCKVGVSCHCVGIKNAVDAVKYHHADIVEKHFMLQGVKCPDEAVSIEPTTLLKLSQILKEVRNG